MDNIVIGALIIGALLSLCLLGKWTLKNRMIQGNQFTQSKATSQTINKLQSEEELKQEQRLLKNPRYKALRASMTLEINYYRSLTLTEIKKLFQNQNVIKKEMNIDGYDILLEVKAHLESMTSPALHITVKPKTLLGFLFSIDEWVIFH